MVVEELLIGEVGGVGSRCASQRDLRRAMERALGLPDGFFDGGAVRVDIPISDSERLMMPSGNEAGANDQ